VLRRGGLLQPLLLEGGVVTTPPWVVTTKLLVTTPLTTPSNLSVHTERRARSDHGYLTTDACEWPQYGCLSTVRLAPHHVVVGHSPDR
jgi:hypothetical protein